MSGSSGGTRLKLLLVFLLASTNISCLHGNVIEGVDHLHCVNDYLFTINCSLNIATSGNYSHSNNSYWLTFKQKKDKFVCMLTNTNEGYFCSVKIFDADYSSDTFVETEVFEIWLCHRQNDGPEISEQPLDMKYAPVNNIKPNAPRFLTVSHNSSRRHFTWISTYEKYHHSTALVDDLQFQLNYYKRGGKRNVASHDINTDSLNYTVDDENFLPDTKYAARVRSRPNQSYSSRYWSDWSPEVYWETESAVNEVSSNIVVSKLGKVLILLCVLVALVLVFIYVPVNKWRKHVFIPTPEPYFHTLYSDCQGDFKSWVVTQENTADMLKAEELLQIDTLTKCEVIEEEEESPLQFHHQFMQGSGYSNISNPGCDTSLLGLPYAVSTMAPPSSPGCPHQSPALRSQPGSHAEGDSGCWLEKDPPWYCNEYCTLSTFQQSSPVTAAYHRSTTKCSLGIIRTEAFTEA